MKIKQITEADSMSQLGQVQAIKSGNKAKIVGMTPGVGGQPATYKVSLDGSADPAQANNPNAPGITNVSADKITKDASGNIVINMNPTTPTGGPDTSMIGKDAQVKEEPNEDQLQVSNEKWDFPPGPTNTYPVSMANGKPVALVGNGKVKIEPASGPFTPELLAKSVFTGGSQGNQGGGFDKCYVRMLNKVYRALSKFDVIKLDPKDYAEVTSYKQLPYNPATTSPPQYDKSNPSIPSGPPDMSKFKALEENPELQAMLRIAGLR